MALSSPISPMITSTPCFLRTSPLDSAVRGEVKMAMRPNCDRWARIAFRMKLPMLPVAPKRRMFWGDIMSYIQQDFNRRIEEVLHFNHSRIVD